MLKKHNNKLLLFLLFLFYVKLIAQAEGGRQLGHIDLLELLRSSFVMIALLLLSLVTLTFVIERWLYFRKINISPEKTMNTIKAHLKMYSFDRIIKMCEEKTSPLLVMVKAIIENRDRPEKIDEIIEIVKTQQRNEMEKYMIILSSSAAVAPLLGLLGTVTGIIKAFADIAKAGTGGPAVVAAGVAEALVTTAFGLIIAIPALLVYNYFANKIKTITSDMEVNSKMLMLTLSEIENTPAGVTKDN